MRCHVLGLQQEGLALAVQVGADDGEAAQGDAGQVVGHEAQELGVGAGHTRVHGGFRPACRAPEGGSRCLKLFVGNQALDQDLAQGVAVERAELLEVFVELVIVVIGFARGLLRHQRGSLDVQKGCRDQQKVARHVKVQRLDALGLGKVLLGHLADGDGADIYFLAGYQLQQQVERSAVDLRRHAIRHLRPPLTAPSRRGLGACCDRFARSTCKFTLDAGDCEVEQQLSEPDTR